jgi:hypothetical protein
MKGIYVRERCDHVGCVRVIGPIAYNGKGNHKVYCSRNCRDEEEHNPTKLKSRPAPEVVLENSAKEKHEAKAPKLSAEKILGVVKKGTTIGNMLTALLDGKWHSKKSMEALRVKEDDSIGWRLTQLERLGAHALREYKLEIADDKARLTFLGAEPAVKVKDVPHED